MIDDAEFEAIPQDEEVQVDLREIFKGAIKLTLESLLEEEIREMVGGARWARMAHRKDVRNGTYLRQLVTSAGLIDVAVPRAREGGAPAGVIDRYARRQGEVDDMIVESYVNGVSTRKVGAVTEALLGKRVSRSAVSRVSKRLDEEVASFEKAPITEPIVYLYLDGTFIDARWARKVENISALVAYGVDRNGRRKLLGISLGVEESAESWTELLRQLVDRGLHGVQLVIADGHEGIKTAVRHVFPEAQRQRCVVHLQRNVSGKVPMRLRSRVSREVWKVFSAPSLVEARRYRQEFKARWEKELPEAVACLENGFDDATRFFDFPPAHWKGIRSTNGLERFHLEIKRRTRAVGAFPDRASALRLIVAVAIRATKTWTNRTYIAALRRETIQQAA